MSTVVQLCQIKDNLMLAYLNAETLVIVDEIFTLESMWFLSLDFL